MEVRVFRSMLQTELGDGCIRRRGSAWASWKEAYERPSSRCADPRLVVIHRFSWAQWSKGFNPAFISAGGTGTITSFASRTEIPLTSHGHRLPSLLWGGCPWTWEDAGRTESHRRVRWSLGASETAGQLPAPKHRTSGTIGTTDVPAVGQRGGMQGPGP